MSDDQDPKGISRPQARRPRLFPKWRLSIRGRWAPTAPLCGQCPPTLPRKPPGFIASPAFSGYHTDHEHAATPEFLSAASHRRHLGSGLRRPERRHGLCGPLHVYLRALLYRRPVPHSLHRAAQQRSKYFVNICEKGSKKCILAAWHMRGTFSRDANKQRRRGSVNDL